MSGLSTWETDLPVHRILKMRLSAPVRILPLLLIFILMSSPVLISASRWTKFRSDHFELFTPAQGNDGNGLLVELERARTYFIESMGFAAQTTEPVRVISFDADRDFERYRTNALAVGLYVGAPAGDYILLKSASAEFVPVALHEYAHHVMRHSGPQAPHWLQEGFAEVFSTIRFSQNGVEIGAVPAGR